MKKLARWLPLILWCIAIFNFTASPGFTGAHTNSIIVQMFHLDQGTAKAINFIIRKLAHLSEFGLLAVLTWWVLDFQDRLAPLAWALATVYAATDEWHQHFVPGRTASIRDVLIDSTGALLVIACIYWQKKKMKKAKDRDAKTLV